MLSIQDLQSSTLKELLEELKNARRELLKIRIGVKTKIIKDISLVKKHKKYIASIKTIIREIEFEEIINNANKITN